MSAGQKVGGAAVLVALAVGATTEPGRRVLIALGDAGRAGWAWISDQMERLDVEALGRSRVGLAVLLGLAAVAVVVSVAAAFRAAISGRVLAVAYLVGGVVTTLLYVRGLA